MLLPIALVLLLPLLSFAYPQALGILFASGVAVSDPKVGGNIEVHVSITGFLDGRPSEVAVDVVSGLYTDNTYPPYLYHIHTNPIPPNGDCSAVS